MHDRYLEELRWLPISRKELLDYLGKDPEAEDIDLYRDIQLDPTLQLPVSQCDMYVYPDQNTRCQDYALVTLTNIRTELLEVYLESLTRSWYFISDIEATIRLYSTVNRSRSSSSTGLSIPRNTFAYFSQIVRGRVAAFLVTD